MVDGLEFRAISNQLVQIADYVYNMQPGQKNAMILSGESLYIIY